jgi:hypothetical protein
MNLSGVLLILFSLTGFSNPVPRPTRILAGTPPAPVVSGEIWLIANRWGAYPSVLMATINNGDLHAREGIQFPPYWEQAFNYKVLVAVSDQPATSAPPLSEDFAYLASGRPQYLNRFPDIYLSPPLPAQGFGKNWEEALEAIGHTSGDVLILAPPARRTIRLEHLDGKPFVDTEVPVSMYGSNENHCGAPVGIELGTFKTDAKGQISFVATNSSLALSKGFFEQKSGGPAGTMFTFVPYVIVDGDQDITVKRLWELPQHDYVVWLRESDNQPIAHAHFTACNNFEGCGEGCGPLFGALESNGLGVMHFRHEDLREMRSLTLVSAGGQKRDLTDSEMNELLTTHQLHLVW